MRGQIDVMAALHDHMYLLRKHLDHRGTCWCKVQMRRREDAWVIDT